MSNSNSNRTSDETDTGEHADHGTRKNAHARALPTTPVPASAAASTMTSTETSAMTPMPMPARMPMPSSSSLSASVSTSASTSTTPLKKSKRQAERMTKGAFAATRRKEKEEERLYHHHHHHHPPKPVPKKPKAAKRRSMQSKPESEHKSNRSANGTVDAAATNNSTSASASTTRNSTNGNVKPSLADGESEAFRKASQVVTPSPTQVPSSSSSPLPLSFPLSSTSTSTSSLKSQNAIEQSLTIQPSQTKAKKRSKGSLSSSLSSSSHGKGEGGIVPLDKDDKMATISGSSNGNGSSMKHNRNHPTPNRKPKRRKIVYEATSGSKRPIDGYALDLVSLVCNNAYCVMTKTGGPHKPKNNNSNNKSTMSAAAATATPSPKHKHKQKTLCFHSQPHRVLDRPSSGYTQESEPLKERLTRLQLRQRFASATSIGMSPIEFSIKLLKIWGGTLEQVYDEKKTVVAAAAGSTSTMASKKKVKAKAKTKTKSIGNTTNGGEKKNTAGMVVSSERNNNCSSLTLTQTQTMTPATESARSRFDEEIGFATISDGDGIKAAIEFDKCMGDLEPRSIHPNARVGERKTNGHGILVHTNGKNNANEEMYVPNHALSNNNVSINGNSINSNINFLQQQNNNVVNSDTNNHSGASMDRIERTKKLKQRRHRKNLKKAEALAAASSLTVDPRALPAAATSHATPSTSSKQKASKKVSRKFMEDPSLPVLFKDMRLSHPKDDSNLNALHCFVRSTLLEVYVIQCKRAKSTSGENDNKKASDEEPQNVVGIRCTQCGFLPREDRGKGQTMSSFFPKSVGEIYRGVCTWQRIHFPVCEHMPEDYRTEYKIRKERDLTRGRKYHWIKSALDMGLRNIDSKRNGMTYEPDLPYDLDEVLRLETDLGGRSRKSRGGGKKTKRSFSEIETKSEALMLSAKGASPGRGLAAPTFAEDEEFELFGDDFEKSLEESEEAAVTMGDESAF